MTIVRKSFRRRFRVTVVVNLCSRSPRHVQGCVHKDSKNVSTEVVDGGWFAPKECTNCTCTSGRLVCTRIECDCANDDHVQSVCCAHCNAQASCAHQELPNVRFRSGQQWIYQCQTCECLVSVLQRHVGSPSRCAVLFMLFASRSHTA